METIQRISHLFFPAIPFTGNCLKSISRARIHIRPISRVHHTKKPIFSPGPAIFSPALIVPRRSQSSTSAVCAGWFLGIGEKKQAIPHIVKAGDPVLHEPAQEVRPEEIGSSRIQNIIDDMVKVMRKAPGVGLAAPQIGIPLKVVINPKLQKKGNKTALFFEGCLSVNGFRAVVERHLEVEATGLDRNGQPIKVDASGWQARILQHECDHLDGTLYVDKMVPRTFRTIENLDLPLAVGCPKLGVQPPLKKHI